MARDPHSPDRGPGAADAEGPSPQDPGPQQDGASEDPQGNEPRPGAVAETDPAEGADEPAVTGGTG